MSVPMSGEAVVFDLLSVLDFALRKVQELILDFSKSEESPMKN